MTKQDYEKILQEKDDLIVSLQAQVEHLSGKDDLIASLQAQIEYLSGKDDLIASLQAQVEHLSDLVRQLNQAIHSPKSEKSTALFNENEGVQCIDENGDIRLLNEVEKTNDDAQNEASILVAGHKRPKRKKRYTEELEPLVTREEHHLLEGDDLACPVCQETLQDLGSPDIDYRIHAIPAKQEVVKHVKHKYYCPCCNQSGEKAQIKEAPGPERFLPKSYVMPSYLALLMDMKFSQSLPLYRIEKRCSDTFAYAPSRQTMSQWIMAAGR